MLTADEPLVRRAEIEDLLYLEAELLDAWSLTEWLDLYTDDARYLVPSPGLPSGASPDENLFLINDDRFRMGGRVHRLGKKTAHPEFPHSITMHSVSNIRIAEAPRDAVHVRGTFYTTRAKEGIVDVYFGRLFYVLVRTERGLRIREKRCELAMEALIPQGRITFIL
jgi:p-cumate 2,3-dioxygenase beta subunit